MINVNPMQREPVTYNSPFFLSQQKAWMLIALVYFFLNCAFLPQGLLITDILTPLFLWWLFKHNSLHYLIYFFVFTVPFILIHFYYNADPYYYYRSYVMFFTAVTFAVCFYVSLKEGLRLGYIFKKILIINFILFGLALLTFPSHEARKLFWYLIEFTPGVHHFPRLKLLTYEPSYYSLLFAPVALYFYLRLMLFHVRHAAVIFVMVTLPLLFSMSFGIIACIMLTVGILICLKAGLFLRKKSVIRLFLTILIISLITALILLRKDPGNPLFFRLKNIFTGKDTSFRGRTYESVILTLKILKEKSLWFGAGLGQVKLIGIPVFKAYYGYLPPVVRIPNTLSDTMATYGIVGLIIRLFITILLFFKVKVWKNYYQLAVFIFIFVYQFTGSFMTNIVEYAAWVLAFTPAFREFDKISLNYFVSTEITPPKKVIHDAELNPVK